MPKGTPFYIFRHYATFSVGKNFSKKSIFFEKNVSDFLSLRYSADFRRSRLVQVDVVEEMCVSSVPRPGFLGTVEKNTSHLDVLVLFEPLDVTFTSPWPKFRWRRPKMCESRWPTSQVFEIKNEQGEQKKDTHFTLISWLWVLFCRSWWYRTWSL